MRGTVRMKFGKRTYSILRAYCTCCVIFCHKVTQFVDRIVHFILLPHPPICSVPFIFIDVSTYVITINMEI